MSCSITTFLWPSWSQSSRHIRRQKSKSQGEGTVTNRSGGCTWLRVLLLVVVALPINLPAQSKKPNILVIFGDDIGQANISRYTHGVVGYMTPNIDRIGEEGMTFTITTPRTVAPQDVRRLSRGNLRYEPGSPKWVLRARPSAFKNGTSRSRRRLSR